MRKTKDELERAVGTPGATAHESVPAEPADVAPTDGELLERVARRDREAFEVLYQRYAKPVYGLAIRRLGDRGRAEDAVQETFTSVWRSAASYRRERGPGGPWLYAVARNSIVDRARARTEALGEPTETASNEAGPAERAEADWTSWRIHRALEDLPAHERTVLELAYWSELSQSEVAEFLAIPLGTVKTRTRSGLARLAAMLEAEDLR